MLSTFAPRFSGSARTYATIVFILTAVYFGWFQASPILVLTASAGLIAGLSFRLPADQAWSRWLQISLVAFLCAEIACLLNLYLIGSEILTLAHDACHVVSLCFLFFAVQALLQKQHMKIQCPLTCCANGGGWEDDNCQSRNCLAALLGLGLLTGVTIVGVWWLDQNNSFLGLPEGMTPMSRSVDILAFPGVALVILSFVAAHVVHRRRRVTFMTVRWILLSGAFLAFSYFQLVICLLNPSVAIPFEETSEFLPTVPLFYVLTATPQTTMRKNHG